MLPVGYGQNVRLHSRRGPATTNRGVALLWENDQPAHSGHMTTDGRDIYSYALRIGFTDPNGRKVVFNYRGGRPYSVSVTTSHHVSEAAAMPTPDNLALPTIASVPTVGG